MHNQPCWLCVFKGSVCLKDVERVSEAIGGVRTFVSREYENTKTEARWSGCCSPERHQFRGQLRLFWGNGSVDGGCQCVCYAQTPMCEHVYVSACAGWGYTQLKMDPSGLAFSGQVPVDGERKESEMMMRVGGGWPMRSSRDGAAC